MANNPQYSIAVLEGALNSIGATVNTGFIEVYTGAQPANPDTSATGTLLVTLDFSATAFASATGTIGTGATMSANTITAGTAGASGTAGYFRCYASNGTTACFDGTVGTSGTDMTIPSTSIVSGQSVPCTSFVITSPQA
jgi:hypothetical protein